MLRRFAFSLLMPAVLTLAACASGSAIVTGTTRAALAPEQVRLYAEPPAVFEVIGLVSASSDAGLTEQGSMDYAIAELKKQAGKLGANGLIIVSSSGVNVKSVQAKAIFTK